MKYILLLFSALMGTILHAQSFDYLKKLDTIYIPFRENEFNIKVNFPLEVDGFKNRRYIFNNQNKGENTFYFEFKKNASKIVETKNISKRKFKQYKNKIVEINSLLQQDYQDIACNLFNQMKTIYIFDLSEKKCKNVKLYRVISINLCNSLE